MKMHPAVKAYLAEITSRGGKARARNNSKAQLSAWAKLGGRPRKHAKVTKRTKQSATASARRG